MMDAAVSGGMLSIPTHTSRKEWRVVGDGSPSRFSEDSSRLHGTGRSRAANTRLSPPQVFQSRSTDQEPMEDSATFKEKTLKREEQLDSSGRLVLPDSPEDGLQQLNEIVRQREQLQNMELEIRSQFIARSEILRIQSGFEEQSKKNASIVANLQEQVQEREMRIHDLKQQLDEKEHQLQANRMEASEAVSQVWAKDGLLLEQKNELASSRRERDNAVAEQKAAVVQFEVERGQLLAQVQDLKDQAHEKELQMQGIAEQHHTAQDLLKYKDGQLRDAQAWIQRAQERDAFLANTNNSLHAELRDRTDQINQLWLSYQRQLAELERYHAQTVQRLQVEITEMREQNLLLKGESKHEGSASVECSDDSPQPSETISKLSPGVLQNNHSKNNNTILQREAVSKAEHATGTPLTRAQAVGVSPVALSSAPVTTLMHHSFGAQSVLPPMLQVNQPTLAQFLQPIPTAVPTQQGQSPIIQHQLPQTQRCVQRQVQHHGKNQSNIKPPANSNECHESPLPHDLDQLSAYQGSGEGEQVSRLSENVDSSGPPSKVQQMLHHLQQQQNNQFPLQKSGSHISWSHQDQWQYQIPSGDLPDKEELEQQLRESSVHPNQVFKKEAQSNQQEEVESEIEGELSNNLGSLGNTTTMDNRDSLASFHHTNEASKEKSQDSEVHSSIMPVNQQQPTLANGNNKVVELRLLDEKSLLACLVRAIPSEPSAKIRISTTLPNRLGKMLAPLHWYDYKRQYGRLHDFVGSHPELFVIEGDFIHLREGAHAIVSATTAVAKVAAAAAASVAESAWLPTVAVTPVAQSQVQRLKILKAVNAAQRDPEQGNTVQKPFRSSSDERASSTPSSSQGQSNGSSRGIQGQGPLIKKMVENKKIGNSHTVGISVNATVQHDEQPVMKILGAQSQVIMSTENDLDIEKTSANAYGNARVLSGRNDNYFVNGQMGRNLSLVSGAFVKQQMSTWCEAQGNPVSRSTSAH